MQAHVNPLVVKEREAKWRGVPQDRTLCEERDKNTHAQCMPSKHAAFVKSKASLRRENPNQKNDEEDHRNELCYAPQRQWNGGGGNSY